MTLGRGQKVKYHLHVNFKDFYTKLFLFLQIKDRIHVEQNFHSVPRSCPGLGLGSAGGGGGGVKNFSMGICDARSSL